MPTRVERREGASLAYENAGREITQAFDILNSNLTLAAGTLAALLAVLGAGELFKSQPVTVEVGGKTVHTSALANTPHLWGIPRLSSTALLLLAAAFPFIVRFFIRATLGYQQLLRFNLVQRNVWAYLSGTRAWDFVHATMDVYVQNWRSPESLSTLLLGSLKYGFVWVFAVAAGALAWGLVSASGLVPRLVAGGVVLVGTGLEIRNLRKSSYFKTPKDDEQQRLSVAESAAADELPADTDPPTMEVVEETKGLFLGMRRRFPNRPGPGH